MRNFKLRTTAAFVLAAGISIAGSEALAAESASEDLPYNPASYRARLQVCDPRQIQYVLSLGQNVEPHNPAAVPREVYAGIREIFRESATQMMMFLKKITENPIDNQQLSAAVKRMYDELQDENTEKIIKFLEKWPPPHDFTVDDFAGINMKLMAKSGACAEL